MEEIGFKNVHCGQFQIFLPPPDDTVRIALPIAAEHIPHLNAEVGLRNVQAGQETAAEAASDMREAGDDLYYKASDKLELSTYSNKQRTIVGEITNHQIPA